MPYKSQAQAAYFNTHKAQLEKQGVNVDEWNQASKGKEVPKRVDGKSDMRRVKPAANRLFGKGY